MRALVAVVGSLAVAVAEPDCVLPTGINAEATWNIENSVTEDKSHCFGRALGDYESLSSCNTMCTGLSGAGVANGKIGCMDTSAKIDVVQGIVEAVWPDSHRFVWSNVRKTGTTWADSSCENALMQWGTGLPADTQAEWVDPAEAHPAGTTTDSSIWVLGKGPDPIPTGAVYGEAPYMTDVTGEAPNPADVFCICEWDVFIEPIVITCANNDAGWGCCDGDDKTALKTNALGTNCVGGTWYDNADANKKAAAGAIAAVAGMATGILVAVIVVPILGVILLIICIVCLCKQCNKSPSA